MRRLVLSVLIWAVAAMSAGAACQADRIALKGDWGRADFRIEVADTDETRARGLMFVERMSASAGMLFVYPRPQQARFWMKNTLIPLDMLFMDRTGTIRRIHANAVPGSTASILGGSGILAVLEINGGLAARLGITEGSVARHPAFGDDAAWPCDAE
jgi:uncharacterized membrane protein (UPF0127 family)